MCFSNLTDRQKYENHGSRKKHSLIVSSILAIFHIKYHANDSGSTKNGVPGGLNYMYVLAWIHTLNVDIIEMD